MLYQADRHEALHPEALAGWDEGRARDCIQAIVRDTEAEHRPGLGWPMHPLDGQPGEDLAAGNPTLYFGRCGVLWALHWLRAHGAATLSQDWPLDTEALLQQTRHWLQGEPQPEQASYLMGETPVWLLDHALTGRAEAADRLASLIEGNLDHPARELMWGSPGTLLTAAFMHQRSGEARFAELFRRTAARLWSQLEWSEAHQCHYWTQSLYGQVSSYMDAVHGFVGTALPLIRGRHLLDAADWARWQACIAQSVRRSATVEAGPDGRPAQVNWMPWLVLDAAQQARWDAQPRWLMQYCHGAPGFVINLGGFPGDALDDLLLLAGETTWQAGPLTKGSNLCHGTGGNGHAFLTLYRRTGDARWLARARAFAVHGMRQTEAHTRQYGQRRHSLWTGDLGFAVYLWQCVRGEADFPTMDLF